MEIELKFSSNDANSVYAYVKNEAGITQKKLLDMATVLQLLQDSSETEDFGFRTGRMPDGFVDSMFNFQSMTGIVAIHIPRHIQPLNYNGELEMIPFPNILMAHKFKHGVLQQSLAFSCMEDIASQINDDTELYHYPFGNVSANGRVCWGSNRHEKLVKISDVNLFTDKFFNSETNADLYEVGVHNTSGLTIEAFLHTLKGVNIFDDNLLSKNMMTFGHIMRK